jgi:hypothetical protein
MRVEAQRLRGILKISLLPKQMKVGAQSNKLVSQRTSVPLKRSPRHFDDYQVISVINDRKMEIS